MSLTPEGLTRWRDVREVIYAHIKLLQEVPSHRDIYLHNYDIKFGL